MTTCLTNQHRHVTAVRKIKTNTVKQSIPEIGYLTGSWSMLIQDYYGVIIIIFFWGGGGNFLDYVDCKGGVIFFFW